MPTLDANTAATIQAVAAAIQSFMACISLLTVIGTLAFLYIQSKAMITQTKEQTIATKATIFQNLNSTMIDIDKFFVDNSDLKKYFYEGKDVEAKNTRTIQIESVAEMILDFMDHVLSHAENLKDYPWDEWELYFQYLYVKSPVLRRYWAASKLPPPKAAALN